MNWFGKIIASLLGLLIAGPIGFLIGLWLGHKFDVGLQGFKTHPFAAQTGQLFISTCFRCLGHIAKSDGRVSEREIQVAKQLMTQLGLNESQRIAAIDYFNQGKAADFDMPSVLYQFRQQVGSYSRLLSNLLEVQYQAAIADGYLHPAKRALLQQLCHLLDYPAIPPQIFQQIFESSAYQSSTASYQARPNPLAEAYKILGVNEQTSPTEIKHAYRRLMSQHHPDKLASQGLSAAALQAATAKTQQIKAAYDKICAARGL